MMVSDHVEAQLYIIMVLLLWIIVNLEFIERHLRRK